MEKKTMGTFLAALRRANGMTQRELAEKLNVSDKSVSRWERDEGAPDLALIPVIAEVFSVSCDELLRGERAAAQDAPAQERTRAEKTEKQRRRLLNLSLSRFRTRSVIASALALVGFLSAHGCNAALERALIGFFVGAVFFAAAAALEAIQVNAAFLAVSDDDFTGEDIDAYRRSVVCGAAGTFGVIWTLFAATLPLLLAFRPTYYNGFTLSKTSVGVTIAWYQMLAVVLLALLVWIFAVHLIKEKLIKRGLYTRSERDAERERKNRRLRRVTALTLCAALGVSFFANRALLGFGDTNRLAEGTVFTDFDSFRAYMQQEVEPTLYGPAAPSTDTPVAGSGSVLYYLEDGTPVRDVGEGHTILDREGNTIAYFLWRNRSVVSWTVGAAKDGYLPITAYTQEDLSLARQKAKNINTAFYLLYVLETLAAAACYWKKREK